MLENVEYYSNVKEHFKNFSLDLTLCSPRSLRLTQEQLFRVLTLLQDTLPSHLKELPLLKLTLQASYEADDELQNNRMASIQVFTPHSITVMMCLEVKITDIDITVVNVTPRPLATIRKTSMFGETKPAIMIVDDDLVLCTVLSRWIKSSNPSVGIYLCHDGLKAVEYYKANFHLSLIFMDIQMPVLGGDAATQQIREFERFHSLSPTPIVGITATNVGQGLMEECGMTDLCRKPLTVRLVLEKLTRYLHLKDSPVSQTSLPEIATVDTGEDDTSSCEIKGANLEI